MIVTVIMIGYHAWAKVDTIRISLNISYPSIWPVISLWYEDLFGDGYKVLENWNR